MTRFLAACDADRLGRQSLVPRPKTNSGADCSSSVWAGLAGQLLAQPKCHSSTRRDFLKVRHSELSQALEQVINQWINTPLVFVHCGHVEFRVAGNPFLSLALRPS